MACRRLRAESFQDLLTPGLCSVVTLPRRQVWPERTLAGETSAG